MKKIDKIFINRLVTLNSLKTYVNSAEKINYKSIENRILDNEVLEILNKYNLSLRELCYRLKYNIPFDKIFNCKVCGKQINFCYIGFLGYRDYCSKKCSIIATSKDENAIIKREQTMLKKFGTKSFMGTKEFQDNREINMLKKYGVKSYAQTKEFKDFMQEHKQEIVKKTKQTCLEKYGVDCYTKTKEYKDNFDKVKKKMEQTCLERYGVDCYNKTQEFKDKFKDKNYVNNILNKIYITKKKNNSFNTSKDEEEIYNLLLKRFNKNDVFRNYKSELYPYKCDFYIKSLDLYIEYNGMWTHGWYDNKCLGSFDKNNKEHQKILELWESKNTKFYKRAIDTWTRTDVNKLIISKQNKLNYKIFWNMEEFNEWYKTIL